MSSGQKVPRGEALKVAAELTRLLRPECEPGYFVFAGSLRRMRPMVGDLEVVYVPRIEARPDPGDLLGHPIPTNLVDVHLNELLRPAGMVTKRPKVDGSFTWGAQNKLAVWTATGLGVDFFQTDKDNFWSLLVCRTGPMEFNTRVCLEAERRGLKWNPYRGFEDRFTKELVFVPRSERGLFDFLRWPYLEPKDRA